MPHFAKWAFSIVARLSGHPKDSFANDVACHFDTSSSEARTLSAKECDADMSDRITL
jgi:hypothetical protein